MKRKNKAKKAIGFLDILAAVSSICCAVLKFNDGSYVLATMDVALALALGVLGLVFFFEL